MEGNIDKIMARRFKRRGMSWSKDGAHGLAKILALRSNGELADWMRKRRLSKPTGLGGKASNLPLVAAQGLQDSL